MKDNYILFEVAGTTYAVPAAQVQQIEMIETVTRVPNAPRFVDGVVYVRGQVVPVLNLRLRFGLENQAPDLRSRLLVVNLAGRLVGLAVDSAREFVSIAPEAIQPPPDPIAGESTHFVQGVAAQATRMIFIVALEKLLGAQPATPGA